MQPPPMPTVVDSEEWFNVDQILNHRDLEVTVRRATKHEPAKTTLQREYYIKCQGHTDDHNPWNLHPRLPSLMLSRMIWLIETFPPFPLKSRESLAHISLASIYKPMTFIEKE